MTPPSHSRCHLFLGAVLMLVGGLGLRSAPTADPAEAARSGRAGASPVEFCSYDLWLDSGSAPLVAYQLQITYDKGRVRVVGLEGGAAPVYREAPYYDRTGFEAGRIIVAAFTTDHAQAPTGRTRVARIHLAVPRGAVPELGVPLMAAARPGGARCQAAVEVMPTPATAPAGVERGERP